MIYNKIRRIVGTFRCYLVFRNAGEVVLISTSILSAIAGIIGIIIKQSSPVIYDLQAETHGWQRRAQYIYVHETSTPGLSDENSDDGRRPSEQHDYPEGVDTAKHVERQATRQRIAVPAARLFQWFRAKQSNDARTLIRLARSQEPKIHRAAVQTLATTYDWTDAEYVMISQAIDQKTTVELARYPDIDIRFFRPPPSMFLYQKKGHKDEELQQLLSSLSTDDVDPVTKLLTSRALPVVKAGDDSGAWCFGGISLGPAESHIEVPAEKLELMFLEALASHSAIPTHCHQMVERGVLVLLNRLYDKRQSNLKIMHLVLRIVANTAYHEILHEHLFLTGWIRNLVECSTHEDLELSTQAARALYNLDRANEQFKLQPGVYMFHPQHRSDEPIIADIIFIHGLRGGAFKTWRQADRPVVSTDSEDDDFDDVDSETYTFSWPKDWLARDLPNLRILTVEYEAFLSKWSAGSEPEKQSIKARASEIFEKLKAAGVGSRPVILVGHSMGGLLVKDMVVNNSVLSGQTIGCIFYGVPHFGSPLADSSSQSISRKLLYPSVVVTELQTDSPNLMELNKNFKECCANQSVACLSFGESKTYPIGLNMKVTIVPPESSNPGFGVYRTLACNHLDVCKPASKHSGLYKMTRDHITQCLDTHPLCEIKPEEVEEETAAGVESRLFVFENF